MIVWNFREIDSHKLRASPDLADLWLYLTPEFLEQLKDR
jgi:hypothetical protein